MGSASRSLKYQPLHLDKREIRLLVLDPSSTETDVINSSLRHVSLDDKPHFAALSYVWGDPNVTEDIVVDGCSVPVTVNLKNGLGRIRSYKELLVVWVDAISINQNDVQEKNTQIPLMSSIYASATSVAIWLGNDNPNINLALSWAIENVPNKLVLTQVKYTQSLNGQQGKLTPLRHYPDSENQLSQKAKLQRNFEILRAYEGYLDLFHLQYWKRVWTYQELRLPIVDPICFFGDSVFTASTILGDGWNLLRKDISDIFNESHKLHNETEVDHNDEDTKSYLQDLNELSRTWTEKNNATWLKAIIGAKEARSPSNNNNDKLVLLLLKTGGRQCYDLRDKIYGLYGLLPEVQRMNPPDYTKSPERVILLAMAYIINQEGGACMYLYFGLLETRLSRSSYPSWVPDLFTGHFDSPHQHRCVTEQAEPLSQFDMASRCRVSIDHSTLHLWARSMGACKVVLRFENSSDLVLRQITGLIKLTASEVDAHPIWGACPDSKAFSRRIARLCVSHDGASLQCTTDDILHAFNLVMDSLDLGGDGRPWPPTIQLNLIHSSMATLAGKTLFMLDNGWLGIGVGDVQSGDVVTLPPQIGHPLLLRKESVNGTGSSVVYFRMVGLGIVDGVMQGELHDSDMVEELEKLTTEQFLIH